MNQEVELVSIMKPDNIQDINIVVEDDENVCVICLESLDDKQSIHFHCGHIFHLHCILEWIYNLFEKNADISCPICRYVECHARSPYYNIMKNAVGYTQPQHNHNVEVQSRHVNNNVNISTLLQRVNQNNQQTNEDGLKRGFQRFMTCLTIIIIGFFSFLIYGTSRRR